ncbi:RNA polymerase II mediator complex component SRB4 [Xylariales sp. AK1849]|nr:RNA polymerase II mediator complex component SRB4 [Xylariales sp. AK1849]
MASISASPFSLRPWPTGDKKPKNLGEFIARVNAERGGFRNVTEVQLREEIQLKDEGRLEVSTSSPEGDSESEDEDDVGKTSTIITAREEFLKNIEFAHQSAMLSLDFISLLISKETPNQANVTLSPALRDLVGLGVLGASKLQESNITAVRAKDDTAVGTGWRLMGINKMVDNILADAERLEKEISLETKYWADVHAVSENGWAVASLPYEPHTLGVRFGFAEAAPEYRNSSIAPLRRNDDGTVRLDRGRVGGGSQRIRAIIQKDGQVTGKSPLPGRTRNNAPLQDRVLEARNTALSQEIWYEINREARTLLSLDVRLGESSVVYDVDTHTKIILTLEDIEEPDSSDDLPDSQMAQIIILGLYLLVISAHRLNYHKRSQASQPLPGRNASPYNILRFLISHLNYDRAGSRLLCYLTDLTTAIKHAGLSTASFTQSIVPIGSQLSNPQLSQLGMHPSWRIPLSESLIISLVYTLQFGAELTVTPEARISVRGRSFISPLVSTQFIVTLLGSSPTTTTTPGQDQPQSFSNPLEDAYPPNGAEPYPNVDETIYYLRQASARAIINKLTNSAAERLGRDDVAWSETLNGAVISDRGDREVRIDILDSATPVLSLHEQRLVGKDISSRHWTWSAGGDNREKIEDLVVNFFRGDDVA